MKKRITALALAFGMVMGTVALAAGGSKTITVSPMTLTVNGQEVTPTKSNGAAAEVFAYDGATYVPLRYLSELLGVQVEWDKNDPGTVKLTGDITLPSAGGDGTYTGKASGFGGEIVATVTVAGGKITACKLEGAGETPAIGGAALPTLEAQVTAAGSADIDGVSGATLTSNGVKAAVAAALAQASGTGAASVKMKPGTYTASANGFSLTEKVPVSVTVSEDKITGITIDEDCAETTIILRNVQELLVPRMIEAQSVSVDAVTGATATSSAVKTAVADCVKQALVAGGSSASALSAFQVPSVKANAGKQETLEGYDVIVVGVGGAGTMAAASAADQGLKVLAVEKAGKIGGTSVVASEPMAINPAKFQAEHNNGKDYIDKSVMRKAWLEYTTDVNGVQKAKEEVVDVLLDKSGEMLDWLVYDHGFTFGEPRVGFTAADVYLCRYNYVADGLSSNDRRTGTQAMYDGILAEYASKGGELMLETEGTEVLMENGKAVGIKAVDLVDGTEYTIKGKAVVLCTGGFAGNAEMVDQYVTQNEFFDFSTTGGWGLYGMYQNDGKMIASAIANGAAPYNISMPPMVHNTATPTLIRDFDVVKVEGTNVVTGRSATNSINDIPQIMSQAANILVVGNDGKRLVDEASMGMLGSWRNGREFYAIWSTTQIEDVKANGFKYVSTSRYLGQGGVPVGEPMPEIYNVLAAGEKAGIVYKADTLAGLAKAIGVPAEGLEATVKTYNTYCKNGEDKEFGKKAEYLDPIGEGPYYCVVGAPYCYATVGGLEVDENLNVIDTKGKPIEGLYACGEDSLGCLMSDDKAYVTFGGGAQGWALTSGYYVGKVLGKVLK